MKKIVVLTGAGISKESGIPTFRDSDGLWRGIDYMKVASADAWKKNPARLLEHYNERRKVSWKAQPNAAHRALVQLEEKYQVQIITQNIDRLHERAGSEAVLHLHGEL
ncbi:MAG: Sir2 family NAD-dependent protein deacetylase, partial [Bacteroidota bacterium]